MFSFVQHSALRRLSFVFYRCSALWRWAYDTDWSLLKQVVHKSVFVLTMISRSVRKQAYAQGMGRHSQEEVMAIGMADLKALSVFLGEVVVSVIEHYFYNYNYLCQSNNTYLLK